MQPAAPAYYDIIIKNAVVIDGTGRKRFISDIGILNERIAFIGDLKQAKAVLEFRCEGKLIASPGFVDMHSHSDLMIFSDDPTSHVNRGDLPKIKQGVTLQVVGQDGLSLAPVRPVARVDLATKMSGLCGVIDDPWDWEQVSDYLAKAEGRLAVNMAFLVGHCTVREYVMGPTDREANIRDRLQMGEVVKRAMREGAFGFSTGLIYEPAMFADFKELDHLARIVAQHNGFFVAHIRNETDRVIEALNEFLTVGKTTGVHLHVSHFKIAGDNNFSKIDELVKTFTEYKSAGNAITFDQYPYIAGSTYLHAIMPPWSRADDVDKTIINLQVDMVRERMAVDIFNEDESEWDNFYKMSGGFAGIQIAAVRPDSPNQDLIGKRLSQVAQEKGFDLSTEEGRKQMLFWTFDLLAEERLGVSMISYNQSEENVRRIMQLPGYTVSTDGLVSGKPHPRVYGTYPRVLGLYTRQHGLHTLEDVIHHMSLLPAEILGVDAERGSIDVGKYADIVLFDPETIIDRATFEDSIQYPTGIEAVIVNGQLCYDNREGLDMVATLPGKVLRHDVAKPRQVLKW